MAVINIEAPCFSMGVGGDSSPYIDEFAAAAGQTWHYGNVLTLANGVASVAAAAASPLLGIAMSECPYLTRTDLTRYPVCVFTSDSEFEMNVWADDTQALVTNSYVETTHRGVRYALAISGAPNNVAYVVNIGSAASVFRILRSAGGSAGGGKGIPGVTDAYQRVIVSVDPAALALSI